MAALGRHPPGTHPRRRDPASLVLSGPGASLERACGVLVVALLLWCCSYVSNLDYNVSDDDIKVSVGCSTDGPEGGWRGCGREAGLAGLGRREGEVLWLWGGLNMWSSGFCLLPWVQELFGSVGKLVKAGIIYDARCVL